MTTRFEIVLPGEPIPQQRPRIFAKGAMDPCWKAKQQQKEYIKSRYPLLNASKSPLSVEMQFIFPYPKSMSEKKRLLAEKVSRPDIDNLIKYVFDMGNTLMWEDDSLVVSITANKTYGLDPRTIISILELT